jgi:hypothetical protein
LLASRLGLRTREDAGREERGGERERGRKEAGRKEARRGPIPEALTIIVLIQYTEAAALHPRKIIYPV